MLLGRLKQSFFHVLSSWTINISVPDEMQVGNLDLSCYTHRLETRDSTTYAQTQKTQDLTWTSSFSLTEVTFIISLSDYTSHDKRRKTGSME